MGGLGVLRPIDGESDIVHRTLNIHMKRKRQGERKKKDELKCKKKTREK